MPTIRSSTDLRNNYNDISTFCHEQGEPVFVTKNGRGDLAVMSIEMYEQISGENELFTLLAQGRQDALAGRVRPYHEAMEELLAEIDNDTV